MKSLQVQRLGEPAEVLELVEVPTPTAGPGELVVKVGASTANFPDVLMCRGQYQERPDLPFTPGIEVCGQIVEVGPGVFGHRVGDRVLGGTLLPHGGFAEYTVMPAAQAFAAPSELDDAEASALFVGYQTGWFALRRRTELKPGQTLVVHAAAGGVGSAAVQLGKAYGATVIGVVGGPEKAEVARGLGADVVVDRHAEDFVEVVKEHTNGAGADLIYDPVGGQTFARSTKCIAFEGSILIIGFAGGEIQSAALSHALIKNYSLVGLHWGLYRTKAPTLLDTCHDELCALVSEGRIRPIVSERLSLADTAAGLQRLADGVTVGRLALVN
jgi:NADPH2:quinone reductase